MCLEEQLLEPEIETDGVDGGGRQVGGGKRLNIPVTFAQQIRHPGGECSFKSSLSDLFSSDSEAELKGFAPLTELLLIYFY